MEQKYILTDIINEQEIYNYNIELTIRYWNAPGASIGPGKIYSSAWTINESDNITEQLDSDLHNIYRTAIMDWTRELQDDEGMEFNDDDGLDITGTITINDNRWIISAIIKSTADLLDSWIIMDENW